MPDNVPINTGTGANVATDQRTINGESVHVQRMVNAGSTAIAHNHVVVDTTAGGVEIAAARETRNSILIVNRGTVSVYIGSGSVSSSNGIELKPDEGLTLNITGQVKAITASSSVYVHYIEEYDT